MNIRIVKKFLIFSCIVFVTLITLQTKSFASDYQYKVLDPKYNSQAQALIEGKLDNTYHTNKSHHKSFDFGTFLALFVLVIFPVIIIKTAYKALKNMSETIPTTQVQSKVISKTEPETNSTSNINTANTVEPQTGEKTPINNSNKNYTSSPISKLPNPMLLNTSPLSSNKGLCVVEYNKKYSLIGYINNDIFLLDQFDSLKNTEIRSRLTETNETSDKYIVKLGEHKAIVEVNEKDMKLLLEL